MRISDVAAALVSFSCALLMVSCVQSAESPPDPPPGEAQRSSGPEPIGEAQQESGRPYVSEDFPFVVIVEDDGKAPAGGWQRTTKTFKFGERNWFIPSYLWQCRLEIEMPLRTEKRGPVSASAAALMTAGVANEVIDPLLDSRPDWRGQGEVFCQALKQQMLDTFKRQYPWLGARVQKR